MIIELLLALQTVQPSPPTPVGREQMQINGSIEIPNEIAPAVGPYAICLAQSAPTGRRDDCAEVRTAAARQADVLLRRQGVTNAAERTRKIEAALTSINNAIGPAAMQRLTDRLNAPEQPKPADESK